MLGPWFSRAEVVKNATAGERLTASVRARMMRVLQPA